MGRGLRAESNAISRPPRALVTGGCGFIGSHIVDGLLQMGWEVIVVDNLTTGRMENISDHLKNKNLTVFNGDICDFDFGKLYPVDYVFHLAARARVQPSIHTPAISDLVNINGSVRVFKYAADVNAKVIFSSSSSVYGNPCYLPAGEHMRTAPLSPYALQKDVCEQYLRLFGHLYGLRWVALRYFNVYGERQLVDGPYATVMGIFMDQYFAKKPFTITSDGEQRRDFTYVGDVAHANILAATSHVENHIINIGGGHNHSVNEVANLIDATHPKDYIDARAGEPRETLANITDAKTLIDWTPQTKLIDWLPNHVWQRKNLSEK